MSFDSIADSSLLSPLRKQVSGISKIFGSDIGDPLGIFNRKDEKRLEVPAPPPTRVEADVNLAKLDARERRRRSSKGGQTSQGLGTPQLSQPTLSQRLG